MGETKNEDIVYINKDAVLEEKAESPEEKPESPYEELHFDNCQKVDLPELDKSNKDDQSCAPKSEEENEYLPVEFSNIRKVKDHHENNDTTPVDENVYLPVEFSSQSAETIPPRSFYTGSLNQIKKPVNSKWIQMFILALVLVCIIILIVIVAAKSVEYEDNKKELKAELKYLETKSDVREARIADLEKQVRVLSYKLNDSKKIELTQLHRNITILKMEIKKMKNEISAIYCGVCDKKASSKITSGFFCDCRSLRTRKDCLEYYQHGFRVNGVYRIHQNHRKEIDVYCDQSTQGGGWTVIQRRVDATVDFNRYWVNYTEAFGDLDGNFWLGNNNIFTLTIPSSELLVRLEDWNGIVKYAKYSSFKIDDRDENYKLHVSGYSGDAGDSLVYHDQMLFSALDKDLDSYLGHHCAQYHKGGWWYKRCSYASLNGLYGKAQNEVGIIWKTFRGFQYSLKSSEMKVRRKTG